MRVLVILIALLWTAPAWATTYYVATTGSDAAAGTSAAPFRSIQKCANTAAAGDTCTVANGTYTHTDGGGIQTAGIVAYIRSGPNVHGTAQNPITIRATNYLGATITVPSIAGLNTAFYMNRNYWNIEGFEITGGASASSAASHHGVYLSTGSDGSRIHHNYIHDIGRVCSSSGSGFTGIYSNDGVGVTVDHNRIKNIGRYRFSPSENGCTLSAGNGSLQQNDHYMYLHGHTNMVVKYNLFDGSSGIVMGWLIQFFGGTMTNTTVVHNTFVGGAAVNGSINPAGHIILASTVTTATFKNNIHYQPTTSIFQTTGLTCTAVTFDYTYTDNADANSFVGSVPSCATDGGHNLKSQANPFVSAGTGDYTIASGAAVIDAGVAITGMAYNGTAPDIGAFETFKCNASGTVNGNFMDTTCAINLHTPVIPASGITGMVALVGGVARTTTSSAVLAGTDSVVRTIFTGAVCAGGETWTNTYTAGNLTDSALIGGSLNQKAITSTSLSITNACGGSVGPTFTPVVSSTFTRADENPLSEMSVWTVTNGGTGSMKILSNTLSPTNFGADSTAKYSGASFNADQYSTADLTSVSTTGTGIGMGLCVRCVTGSDTKYAFHIDHAVSNNAELAKKVGGTYTFLDHWTQAFTNGDTFTLAIVGENLYVYDKTTTLVRGPIATGGGSSSGQAGVSFSASTSSGTFADNWVGGNFSLTPPPPASCTLTQPTHRFYDAYLVTAGSSPVALAAVGGDITLTRPNLSFAIVGQVDATVAGCSSGFRVRYSRNGGPYLEVPDTMGADQIAFFGSTSNPLVVSGAVSCCLSGALTHIDGTTQRTSSATPIVTFTQDSSTVQRYVITLGASAVATDTYAFRLYDQNGNALNAYTDTGVVTVGSTTLSVPGSFQSVGPASNTNISLIWAPVADTALAGYKVYQGTTSGVYGAEPICNITVASAIASQSSMTQCNTVVPLAGTYYFIVKSVDTGGNQSAASSEVSVVRTGFAARTPAVPQ